MKFYLISDSSDALVGMRLAGIEGTRVHRREDTAEALKKALDDKEIGIILMTPEAAAWVKDEIALCNQAVSPLIVTIPDANGQGAQDHITQYIQDAIGVKI